MLPRLLLFLAVLCLPVWAQRKTGAPKSDNADAGNAPAVWPQKTPVKVLRGQSVEITLSGTNRADKDMTFLLRQMPRLGRFKEAKPVPKGKLSATITYIAPADKKGGDRDSFTFAAQISGSSVSEPETVTIHILDTAVKLDTVDTVDFKRLVLGHPGEREFLIRNGGTEVWAARVPAPKGWKWVRPADGAFRLEPGAEINTRLSCLADKSGEMEGMLELNAAQKVTLVAKVVPPFSLLTEGAALVWKPEGRTRTGVVQVINHHTAQPLTVTTEGPAWLKAEKTLTVEADKRAPLTLDILSEHSKALTGKLKISAGAYSEEVEVKAAPTPALLSVRRGLDERYGLHFGRLNSATIQKAKRPLTIINEGGEPAAVKLEVPEYFRLESPLPEAGTALAPGMEMTFVLLPPVDTAGTFQGKLVLRGGADTVIVECSAGVDPSALPVTPASLAGLLLEGARSNAPRIRSQEDELKEVSVGGPGIIWEEKNQDPKLPRVDVVEIAEDNGEQVTFAWEVPEGDGWKFQLMRATIQRFSAGNFAKVWEPCGDEVKYTVEGRRATATVKELSSHMPFSFRIRTIAPDGRLSLPGKPISYRPYPPDPSHWQRYLPFYATGAALAVLLGWWMWKRWKAPINALA